MADKMRPPSTLTVYLYVPNIIVSTFGAVLDMITDRISTACLLVILSQVYSTFLVGKISHKDVRDSSNWLFKLYYGNRKFMCYCCVSCEVLYILLFLLAKENEGLIDVLVNAATQSWFYLSSITLVIVGWLIKQIVNVIQMKTAADACIVYDINKKQ